jgi:FAD/FMN-containing dehydrogenase/Fe-S oxidoreductase
MSFPEDFTAELRRHFTGDIRLDLASKILYSTDASIYQIEPLGVLIPQTHDDVQAAVETAAKFRVPILPRGAGTSLAGQAIGEAIILDCSRWMTKIIQINAEERRARVEPGVILSTLNREAGQHGLRFGPDPASAERASIGGVIGNNATGAHSILYGMAADHLLSARVVFSDGTVGELSVVDARPGDPANAQSVQTGTRSRIQTITSTAWHIRSKYAEAIRLGYPKTWRNSAGYRLNYLLPWSPGAPPQWPDTPYPPQSRPGSINLAHLLAGSEGTLAVMTEATLQLVPRPPHSVLAILAYSSEEAACDAVPTLLESRPSAIELIPRLIVQLARAAPGFASQASWVRGDPAALLVVEFSGSEQTVLTSRAASVAPDALVAESAADQASVWGLRKAGLGLLDSRPQAARPAAFIEDCAIPVERLGVFVREQKRILREHGLEGGIYGHASAGCLHTRPILNLKSARGVLDLRQIAEEMLAVAHRLGGSMVSEHGDGMARGEWLRGTYGDAIVEAMQLLKSAADPTGLLSPGKMLAAPKMDTQLRYGLEYRAVAWSTTLDFSGNGDLETAIEQCNGQGVCRQDSGAMCPTFQATRDEMHSTRGRANLLRAMISRRGAWTELSTVSQATFEALDLCLGCKACKAQCPSGVDMAKVKAAFLEHHYKEHLRPLRDYLFGYFHITAAVLAQLGWLVDGVGNFAPVRKAVATTVGLAATRPLPAFRRGPALRSKREAVHGVILVRDPFTHYAEPRVEEAATKLLAAAGFDTLAPRSIGTGAALISKGFLNSAGRRARTLVDQIGQLHRAGSLPLLSIEPSELSTLRHDVGDLIPDLAPDMKTRLARTQSVSAFLVQLNVLHPPDSPLPKQTVLLHPHCHDQAEQGSTPGARNADVDLLRQVGYQVELTDPGCCGMAGTFGYEAEHYEISQKVGSLRLFPRITRSTSSLIAATGAACRLQISQALGVPVEHPLVLAVQALGL